MQVNKDEFEIAQKAMDFLILERRDKQLNVQKVKPISVENTISFIDKSLKEQGYDFSHEEVINAMNRVSNKPSVVIPEVKDKKEKENSHLGGFISKLPLKMEFSKEEAFDCLIKHKIMSVEEIKETLNGELKKAKNIFFLTLLMALVIVLPVYYFAELFPLATLLSLPILGFIGFNVCRFAMSVHKLKTFINMKKKSTLSTKFMERYAHINYLGLFNYKATGKKLFGKRYEEKRNGYVDFNDKNIQLIVEQYRQIPKMKAIFEVWISYGNPITQIEFMLLYLLLGEKEIKKITHPKPCYLPT